MWLFFLIFCEGEWLRVEVFIGSEDFGFGFG